MTPPLTLSPACLQVHAMDRWLPRMSLHAHQLEAGTRDPKVADWALLSLANTSVCGHAVFRLCYAMNKAAYYRWVTAWVPTGSAARSLHQGPTTPPRVEPPETGAPEARVPYDRLVPTRRRARPFRTQDAASSCEETSLTGLDLQRASCHS